jgi:hypothetical protein
MLWRKDSPRGRRLSHSERIIRAIKLARMRFKDDSLFLNEVHKILLREHILEREDFGKYAEENRDEADNEDE